MKKFKVKAAAAAVALVAAGAASAAVNTAGEVTFLAFNFSLGESFVFDTGLTFSQLATTNQTLNLGTAFSTFLTDTGGTFDWMAQSAPSASQAAFTAVAGTTVPPTVPFLDPTMNAYWAYANSAASAGLTTAPGGIILHSSTTTTNWGGDNVHDTTTGTNIFNGGTSTTSVSPWIVTTTGNGTMNFYSFTQGSGRGAPNTSALVDSFTLAGSNLTLAVGAVPEPGTYALMVAGLLAVGAVTRRRLRG